MMKMMSMTNTMMSKTKMKTGMVLGMIMVLMIAGKEIKMNTIEHYGKYDVEGDV